MQDQDQVREGQASALSGGDAHEHDAHEHGDHEHIGHVLPLWLLGAVLGALLVLTVLTVGVTSVDLGSQGNFIVAMVVATIKAALVMGIFMHLHWDSRFNAVVFLSSFLFVLLFLSMTVLDRGEYSSNVQLYEFDQKLNSSK
jgi:cytochrome c oxidase subunit 4